jgi:WD40 repeat protein
MIVGTAVSSLFAVQSAADATDARVAKGDAERAAGEAIEQTGIAKANEIEARQKERLQRRRYYISRINLAQRSLNDSLVAPTLKYLDETIPKPDEEDFRGFEWHCLDRQCRREVRILQGHSRYISSVRYSPDGKHIATLERDGPWDGIVRIWDAATGSEIRPLKYEGGAIEQFAFSPDGKRIASACSSLPKVSLPYMKPDGSFMTREEGIAAAASWNRPLIVWDVETGREALSFKEGGWGVAFSPDGKLIATKRKEGVAVLDSNTGKVVQTIPDPGASANCLAFSPDSKTLAYGGIDNATRKAAVTIWDLTSNKPQHVLLGHSNWVECLAFNPQGRVLASGSRDGTVRLWDTATGKEKSVLRGFKVHASDIAFNPRTTLLKGGQINQGFREGQLLCVCNRNSPDSDGTPRTARIWAVDTGTELDTQRLHIENGTELVTLKGHLGNVTSLAFSPRDNHLASAGADGTVRVWDLADVGDATGVYYSSSKVYFACSEKGAVCAFGQQFQFQGQALGRVLVRDLASGNVLLTVDRPISNLTLSADGSVLAIASPPPAGNKGAAGEITLWDLPSGKRRQTLSGLPQFVEGGPRLLSGLALSSDGKLLASAAEGATIRIRDTYTGNEVCSLPAAGGTSQIVFRPRNREFACINGDGKVRLWDLETRRERLVPSVGKGFPSAVSFSPDRKLMAIAENEAPNVGGVAGHGVVRVREVSSGKEQFVLEGHNNLIRCLAFHPDGRRLITGSDDSTAKLWDLETRQELLTLGNHTHGVHGAAFTGDGHYLLTAEGPIPSQAIGSSLSGQPYPRQFTVRSWNATPHPSRAQDEKLLAVLSGKSELGSAKELMELARFATHSRGKFAATARLFIDYLARRPEWASYVPEEPPSLGDQPSYYAAASASMAARGEGDGAELTDEQKAALRKQALTWMREHVAFCEKRTRYKGLLKQVYEHLKYAATDDGWLAGVRDEKQLANLPELEQKEWRQFWTGLARLREKCEPFR